MGKLFILLFLKKQRSWHINVDKCFWYMNILLNKKVTFNIQHLWTSIKHQLTLKNSNDNTIMNCNIVQTDRQMGGSVWACPRGRVLRPGVDDAFPWVCYFKIHTANNEKAHLTVVEFTDSRNSQNNNFHVWNLEGRIQTEGNTDIWSPSGWY